MYFVSKMEKLFQSTPSAWRETGKEISQKDPQFISIHSLRMEGDIISHISERVNCHFNPLPPHGGRRFLDGSFFE